METTNTVVAEQFRFGLEDQVSVCTAALAVDAPSHLTLLSGCGHDAGQRVFGEALGEEGARGRQQQRHSLQRQCREEAVVISMCNSLICNLSHQPPVAPSPWGKF